MEIRKSRAAKAALAAVTAVALAAALVPAMGATDAFAKAPKKPGKPKSVKAAGKTSSTVTVKWGKAKRAKAYQVRVTKGKRTVRSVTVTKRSAKVTGLSASTTYKAKVRAQSKKGKKKRWGSWSKTVTFRTKAAPRKASPSSPAKPSQAHKHLYYERLDGSGHRDWVCDCGAETTKAPSQSECAHNASWELVPGTFKTTGKCKETYRYCLQCGESWRDDGKGSASKALAAHLKQTGHLDRDNDGNAHDTVALTNTAFASGKEPVERCHSCGATRAHVHSWEHVGDTLDRNAMGGYDSIGIAGGYECKTCSFRTSPCAKWMGESQVDLIGNEIEKHSLEYGKWDGSNAHLASKNYEIYGQIYSCFEHDHCTVCGLNRVS